jgi:hypothetical protein
VSEHPADGLMLKVASLFSYGLKGIPDLFFNQFFTIKFSFFFTCLYGLLLMAKAGLHIMQFSSSGVARNIQFGNRFCAVFLVHKTGGSKEIFFK